MRMGIAEIAVETRGRAAERPPWARRALLLAVAVAALAGVGAKVLERRHHRRAIREIKQEMRAGRYGQASRRAAALLERQPGSDEAAYWLGASEKARGQAQAAYRAWERVPTGSEFGPRAIQGRMGLLIERGRLADAEDLILRAIADPRGDGPKLRLFLGLVYSLQGRIEDRQRVIEAGWERLEKAGEGATEQAILLLRLHIRTPSLEEIRGSIGAAASADPEDDRVWLGHARLAIHDGAYDRAARWLDLCGRRRPDDAAVWRVRLDWALATRRLPEVRKALTHLPASESSPAEVERLAARIAAARGDVEAERRALERLVAIDPADLAALDRLGAIAEQAGRSEEVEEYRRRKAEVGRLRARHDELYRRNQSFRDAAEMANLSDRLGRTFEAKAFRAIALASQPGRLEPEAGASSVGPGNPPQAGTLADRLAAEVAGSD